MEHNKMKDELWGMAVDMAGLISYQENSVVSKTLIDKKAGTITLFAFDSGQGLSEHTAPYDAVVIDLDGEAEITVGGKTVHITPGKMLIMPANVPHAVRATTQFKMMLIMIKQ